MGFGESTTVLPKRLGWITRLIEPVRGRRYGGLLACMWVVCGVGVLFWGAPWRCARRICVGCRGHVSGICLGYAADPVGAVTGCARVGRGTRGD